MFDIYLKLLPVFSFFILGVVLKAFKIAADKHGAWLLKIMFFITLPVLVLVKLSEASLTIDKVYLPLINIAINLSCFGLMYLLTFKSGINRSTLGVMLLCSMVINNFFMFPFILAVLGEEALVEAMIFDIGNAVTTMSLAYAVAFWYGPENLRLRNIFINMIKLPALWALIIALSLNINNVHLPEVSLKILEPFGLLTNPLIMIALGIYFRPAITNIKLLAMTVGVRMVFGFIISVGFVFLLNLQGLSALVVILCGAAPIGFNGLTFSSLAKLDMRFASSAVSTSILIGLFSIPILLYLLQTWIKI